MDKFTPRDFDQYYRNSWVELPQGGIFQIVAVGEDGTVTLQVGGDNPKKITSTLRDLDWAHVRVPELGYRNLRDNGQWLVYFERRVGRITYKGFGEGTVSLSIVPEVADAAVALGQATEDYLQLTMARRWNLKTVEAIYKPVFIGIDSAIDQLRRKKQPTGFALSNSMAIVLGRTEKRQLVLLWKKLPAAYFDGVTWSAVYKEYIPLIKRELGLVVQ